MSKKITMADISKQLGISKMTVSRYFNGGYVSEENRQAIDEIVKAHHYQPNLFARSIRGQSNIIGFVAPRIDSHTTSLVIRGALAAADKYQVRMLFQPTGFSHDNERQAISEFHNLNALGTILIASKQSVCEPFYQSLDNLVYIGKHLPQKCCLEYPEQDALLALLQQVLNNKKTAPKVCYLYDERMLSSRTALFNELMNRYYPKHEFIAQGLANSEQKQPYQAITLCANHYYFCATDTIAIRLYRLAKEQGLIIGKDLWISGIGDYEYSDLLVPSLTSIAFSHYQIGYQAVEKIVKKDFASTLGSYELKIRESSHFS